jgi:hypothetical protein
MRCAGLLWLLVGCRSVLGLEEPIRAERDAAMDVSDAPAPVDASLCFGSFTVVCLETLPLAPLGFGTSAEVDTDVSTACATTTNNVDACVLAGRSITISTAVTLSAVGSKPLILLATDGSITIAAGGTVNVSSKLGGASTGAGFGRGACNAATTPGSSAGGPGGSFGGKGGNGGLAGGTGTGQAGATTNLATMLRGGCAGANAGPGGSPGTGGKGGGAVELISSLAIDVAGTINASGAGGTSGGTSGNAGGGGGGSGGAIVLAAPDVVVSGLVFANGGGGGGGEKGVAGTDPSPPTRGAGGDGGVGGDGGDGSLGGIGSSGENSGNGGGGGGGGAGIIHTTDPTPPSTGISPPFA